jgi:hypothetical protein
VTGKLYTVQASIEQIGELADDTKRGRTRFENHRSWRPRAPPPESGVAAPPQNEEKEEEPSGPTGGRARKRRRSPSRSRPTRRGTRTRPG